MEQAAYQQDSNGTRTIKVDAVMLKEARDMRNRVAQLEHDRDVLAWLHAELLHNWRTQLVSSYLSNPQVQERIRDNIVRAMSRGM